MGNKNPFFVFYNVLNFYSLWENEMGKNPLFFLIADHLHLPFKNNVPKYNCSA